MAIACWLPGHQHSPWTRRIRPEHWAPRYGSLFARIEALVQPFCLSGPSGQAGCGASGFRVRGYHLLRNIRIEATARPVTAIPAANPATNQTPLDIMGLGPSSSITGMARGGVGIGGAAGSGVGVAVGTGVAVGSGVGVAVGTGVGVGCGVGVVVGTSVGGCRHGRGVGTGVGVGCGVGVVVGTSVGVAVGSGVGVGVGSGVGAAVGSGVGVGVGSGVGVAVGRGVAVGAGVGRGPTLIVSAPPTVSSTRFMSVSPPENVYEPSWAGAMTV